MGKFWRAHCMACDYITGDKSNWVRHNKSEKHKVKREAFLAKKREMESLLQQKQDLLNRIAEQEKTKEALQQIKEDLLNTVTEQNTQLRQLSGKKKKPKI